MTFDEQDLKKKGFFFENGAWRKSNSSLDRLETRKHSKQTGAQASGSKAKQSRTQSRKKGHRRKRPPEIIVTMTAHISRYLDGDNLTNALKPIQDALALWVGVDDGEYVIAWECDQTLTRGDPGVCVVIRRA